eukprot:760727-Hanusia_phi.AAC.1
MRDTCLRAGQQLTGRAKIRHGIQRINEELQRCSRTSPSQEGLPDDFARIHIACCKIVCVGSTSDMRLQTSEVQEWHRGKLGRSGGCS